MPSNQLSVDGSPIDFQPGDSLLAAMLRAGLHPTGGGCLCLAGEHQAEPACSAGRPLASAEYLLSHNDGVE